MQFRKHYLKEMTEKLSSDIGKTIKYIDPINIDTHYYIIKKKKLVKNTRWTSINKIIFYDFDTDKYWMFNYEEGLTEHQTEKPFEFIDDEFIECKEVIEKEVLRVETIWIIKE